jgi:hypothetical protein
MTEEEKSKIREDVISWATSNGWKLKRPSWEEWPASPQLTKGNIRINLGEEDACFERKDMEFSFVAKIENLKIVGSKLCFESGSLMVRSTEDKCIQCGKVAKDQEGTEETVIHSNRYDLPHLWIRALICKECVQKRKEFFNKICATMKDKTNSEECYEGLY